MTRFNMVRYVNVLFFILGLLLFGSNAFSQTDDTSRFGIKARFGGRYDNLRMCVATPPGTKGGAAGDISCYIEFDVKSSDVLHIDIPVFRPILFATAFDMLQFEPSVTLRFGQSNGKESGLIYGPTLGISLHYGPDYNSEQIGDMRGDSFFALGPIIGGYFGVQLKRCNSYGVEFGLSPYVTPLFSISEVNNHNGIVIGAMLDALFRF